MSSTGVPRFLCSRDESRVVSSGLGVRLDRVPLNKFLCCILVDTSTRERTSPPNRVCRIQKRLPPRLRVISLKSVPLTPPVLITVFGFVTLPKWGF